MVDRDAESAGLGMEKQAKPPSSTRSRPEALPCVILGRNTLNQHLHVSKPEMLPKAPMLPDVPQHPPKNAL